MNRLATFGLCLLAFGFVRPCLAAPAADAVVADKSSVTPGEKVTLRWYFTGKKVMVAGGRFGKGVVVTGKTALVDAPTKTTKYTFDVWYTGKVADASGATAIKPIHTQYNVVVEVMKIAGLKFATYADKRGWKVDYVAGWHIDKADTSAGGHDAICYFQPEDDAIDRLAVARLSSEGLTCAALMDKVKSDIIGKYQDVSVLTQEQCTHDGCEAMRAVWVCSDPAHDGAKLQSIALMFVQGNDAYVVSARTAAGRFAPRKALLERMVRSFTFTTVNHVVTGNRDLSLAR